MRFLKSWVTQGSNSLVLRNFLVAGLFLLPNTNTHAEATPPADNEPGEQQSADNKKATNPDLLEDLESRFEFLLSAWRLEEARVAVNLLPASPEQELFLGVLECYEANYISAENRLSALLLHPELLSAAQQTRAQRFLTLARGANLTFKSAVTETSSNGRFIAVFVNPKDRVLAPYLFDALNIAYEVLGERLGVFPKHPIRFEFLDDPAQLALLTPLELEHVYTTSTIGITKYRRVMMVSPRVMMRGYSWLDTAVHEFVHYLLSLRTDNRAPVWLQEGLAKLLEARWRRPTVEPLEPPIARLIYEAMANDKLVTLEEMHPSIAMLPTHEQATLAYAEVQTMLETLERERGSQGIALLLDQVRSGVGAKAALSHAWGAPFADFEATWKKQVMRRYPPKALAKAMQRDGKRLDRPEFRDPKDENNEEEDLPSDVFANLRGGRSRQLARLALMLMRRQKNEAAIIEFERARSSSKTAARDPKLARYLGELYLQAGDPKHAAPLLQLAGNADPENATIAAKEGRAHRLNQDSKNARKALQRGIRVNPFIPTLHCDLAEIEEDDKRKRFEKELCPE